MAGNSNNSTLMKRRWVTPVGFGAVLLAFAGFCAVPYFTSIKKMDTEIAEYRAKIENGGRQSSELRDLTKQNQLLRLEVKRYDQLVPPTQDKSNFYEAVSKAQDDSGLNNVNRSTLAQNRLGRLTALPMELKITSQAANFYKFLESLEKLDRRSAVSRLNIEADSKMDGQINVDMTLSIFTMTATKDLPKP